MSRNFTPLMGTFFGLAFKKYGHPVIAIVIGEMIIQLMFNGFVALGAPTTIQNVVTGAALLLIVALTTKPVIYAANIAEEDLGKPESEIKGLDRVEAIAKSENAEIIVISAAIEEEIAQMSPDEKAEFIEGLGIGQSGLDRLITACYRLLGLISFLTAGEDECRAWTIVNGTKAPQAAGKIHTDFEKGFIRAEIVPFDTLVELGSMAACKEKGLVRSEGKDYVMKDGDIVLFRFNV